MPDGVEIAPSSLADLRRLGDAYKAGDRKFKSGVSKSLRSTATELAQVVIREGSALEPERGGLRARLAAARGGVTVALSGNNVSVSIRQKTTEGYALRQIDRGILRHPVFGEKRLRISSKGELSTAWVAQKVPEHAYTDVFERSAPLVRAKLRLAIQGSLHDIAKDAT